MADRDGAVTIAYVHSNNVAHSWHRSLIELVGHDLANHGRVLRGGWLAMRYGVDGIVAARNQAVEGFLADRDAEWLFWLDTDMGFAPDTVDQLIEAADPVERPIVGGLCFAQRERTPDGLGGWRCSAAPTIFDWVTVGEETGFVGRTAYPINTLLRCAGTGSACILIHRSVLERIRDEHGPVWYNRVPNPSTGGQLIGEDLSFCLRAGTVGAPVWVHTGVRTNHLKEFWLSEVDYWERAVAPPAAEQVAVIVPVLHRPEQAEPFMASLRASTGLATAYAVCDRADVEATAAWKAAGAVVLVLDTDEVENASHGLASARTPWPDDPDRPGTFAEKVNIGYLQSDGEPWLLLVGSDVRFHPGWLDHAKAVAGDRYHVIGTNDLGNPRVTSGQHATHLLVRRSYILEHGASWDGPGVVAHEAYKHWWVDDEIVTVAKQRDVWAMALGSVVEHLHPLFGKGEHDDVYDLGASYAEQDRALFFERLREHGTRTEGDST